MSERDANGKRANVLANQKACTRAHRCGGILCAPGETHTHCFYGYFFFKWVFLVAPGYCIPHAEERLFSLPPTHSVRLGFENLLEVTDWVHTRAQGNKLQSLSSYSRYDELVLKLLFG